jgi:DNA processing protein
LAHNQALERVYWLGWSRIPGIGPVLLKRLQQEFGSLARAWEADLPALRTVEGIGDKVGRSILQHRRQLDLDDLVTTHTTANPNWLTPADPAYPPLLWELPDPPPLLYYGGSLPVLESLATAPAVAVVGTRAPTEYGRRWTRRLTQRLTRAGLTIVSGLAAGIDAEAHRSCLEAGGTTIAVVGCGVDVIYPASNRSLYEQIGQRGLILSEYPAGTAPDRIHFPQRNRIVAGLGQATLVLEAGKKSGALITARLANDAGRDVYVLPGSLDNPQAHGCLGLINQGAQLILEEETLVAELASPLLGAGPERQLSLLEPLQPTVPLPSHLQPVWQAVAQVSQPILFDAIVEQLGSSTSSVSSALVELEVMELIIQLPGMRYQLRDVMT